MLMNNRAKHIKHKSLKKFIVICLLFMLGQKAVLYYTSFSDFMDAQMNTGHIIEPPDEWYLLVVNRWNSIPEDFSITLTELSNGKKIDSRIYSYLQEMFDAAREEGIYPIVREGYRTTEEQQEILNAKVQTYIKEGYSRSRAVSIAKEWVAVPGTSEHQLGIAVDINADQAKSSNEEVYEWLAENAYKFGFILRYPQGKASITGTMYEPWHYRYVGKDVAEEIFIKQICLEEYFD